MMRLIVCADGTWNRPEDSSSGATNVLKMRDAISACDGTGIEQRVYYQSGVGTSGGLLDRLLGGAFGEGLDRHIRECYDFLVNSYREGDEVYMFGFSRGAYTVRSLAGLVRNSGILRQEHSAYSDDAFDLYRDRDPESHPHAARATAFRQEHSHDPVKIRCIGVWDTVGALGVPLLLFRGLNAARYAFHDMTLSSRVETAFQALAIDERRRPFAATLWEQPREDAAAKVNWLEQAWFTGVHSNIGGGYADVSLSDTAFSWMIERVKSKTSLAFDEAYLANAIKPDPFGSLNDSMKVFYQAMIPRTRILDEIASRKLRSDVNTWEYVHASAKARFDKTPESERDMRRNLSEYLLRESPAPHHGVERDWE